MREEMPNSSVSAVCSFSLASFSHFPFSAALPMSKRLAPRTSLVEMAERTVLTTEARGFISRSSWAMLACWLSGIRSVLLSTRTSANSTWSLRSCEMQRMSSGPACCPESSRRARVPSCPRKFAPSTTVTSVSSSATSPSDLPSSSAKVNVSATWSGSEMPEDSTTRWSKRRSAARPPISFSRSSRSVQQMQPFDSSTSFSSLRRMRDSCTSAASMFTSAMSFTITATRKPSRFPRMCFSSVVFPAPSIPLMTVTGSFSATALAGCADLGLASAAAVSGAWAWAWPWAWAWSWAWSWAWAWAWAWAAEPAGAAAVSEAWAWAENPEAGEGARDVAGAGATEQGVPNGRPKRTVSTPHRTAAASPSASTRITRCSSGLRSRRRSAAS
mmetsp:Transcript_95376/g.269943  ORF Transcript_95376/g.269943 Transcript_95376/m.269943 type:complete len:386 (+) Transcript_95376:442-1599(+)